MQSYWWWGNNYDFVYLTDLVQEAQQCRSILGSKRNQEDVADEDVEEMKLFVRPGQDYFGSFSAIAEKLWNLIIDPFRKYDAKMDDFLDENVDDDSVKESEIDEHRAILHASSVKESVDENQKLADYYEQRYKEEGAINSEDELFGYEDGSNEQGSLRDTSDEDAGQANSDASSEDEWEQKIRKKRGSIGRRKITPRKTRSRSTPSKRRFIQDVDVDE